MMAFRQIKIYLIPVFLLPLLFCGNFISGQENLALVCEISSVESQCQKIPANECKSLLEKCQTYYDQESDRISKDMSKTDSEKKTLKNKIGSLSQKIKDLESQIKKNNLVIKDLGIQITDTSSSIEKTALAIEESIKKLDNILQNIHEEDEKPVVEILLSENDFSDFFNNVVYLDSLGDKSKEYLKEIKSLKIKLEEQRELLDSEKGELENIVKMHELQKQENSKSKKSQEYYLSITEQEYQKQLKQKNEIEKKASEIKARLFELVGVTKAPTFGEAYSIAKYVSATTGIRPAFLLAVLQQESAIGKNVGQCVLTNSQTGDGKKISTGAAVSRVMKPTRDVTPFLKITGDLGKDPYNTPVSCPMSFGYGGAMGPAQFIPSTWIGYSDRLKAILGRAGDPWSIKDSFLASALYLTDYGSASQKYNDEWKSAMYYFSGSLNLKYKFYADSVMNIAAGFEEDIKAMEAAN